MTEVPPSLTRPSRRRGVYTAIIALLVIGTLVATAFLVALLRDVIAVRHIPVPTLPAEGPISLAFTGDTTRLSAAAQADAAYLAVANAVRRASLGFTNLELSLPNPVGSTDPAPVAGGRGRLGPDDGATIVRSLGFDLVSLANNHAMDLGEEGLRTTQGALDVAGVLHAGAGRDLAAARAPVMAGQGKRRLALIAVTASASVEAMASASTADIRGRAGVNPLRYAADVTVDAATYATLAASVAALNAGPAPGAETLTMFGTTIKKGDRTSVVFTVNAADHAALLESIRQARTQAEIVVLSIHSHEPFNASDEPADFIRQFAHDAIDAGASIVVGHGPHRVRGFELYKEGAIFYSLGHFAYDSAGSALERNDPFDSGRNLFGMTLGAASGGSSVELQQEADEWWQGLLVVANFSGSALSGLDFFPLDLAGREAGGARGMPALAKAERGRAILGRLAALSGPSGTLVQIEAQGDTAHVPISVKR